MRRHKTKRQVRVQRQLGRIGTKKAAKSGWAKKQAARKRAHRTKHGKFSYGR